MGFPQQMAEGPSAAVFVGLECKMRSSAFTCPRCKGSVPELPCSCHICGLTWSRPHSSLAPTTTSFPFSRSLRCHSKIWLLQW